MNTNRYCRSCGETVGFGFSEFSTVCPRCKQKVTRKTTMAEHTFKARVSQLRAMHNLMCEANDEYIYMEWIDYVPDEPFDEDFESIALNDESYNECFDVFVELIARKGNRY